MIEVTIPDLGSDEGADLVEILVPAGTEVQEGDSLVLLESDKASMEVPAPSAGVLTEWLVETGATVREGVVIAAMADPRWHRLPGPNARLPVRVKPSIARLLIPSPPWQPSIPQRIQRLQSRHHWRRGR